MAREIKFRAWDKKNNIIQEEPSFSKTEWLNEIFKDENLVLMQYTGVKDKNEKEIYEGDIVEAATENTLFIWEVRWDGGGYFALKKGKDDWVDFDDINNYTDGIEVIGNIYENPELL